MIVPLVENRYAVNKVCVELKLCSKPISNHTDPLQLPTYRVDLGLPPNQRFNEICSNEVYGEKVRSLLDVIEKLLPADVRKDVEALGQEVNSLISQEYAQEIQGCASKLNAPYGAVT